MPEPRVVELTRSEFLVARAFLFDGCDNETVARRVDRKLETVKTHMVGVLHKTEVRNRAQLVAMVWSGRIDLHCKTNPSMRDTLQRMISAESFATP